MSNPYAEALEELLAKVTDPGKVDEGQRRGIRRAIRVVNKVWEDQMIDQMFAGLGDEATRPEPVCFVCKRPASEIPDVLIGAEHEETTPAEFAREDGTYNSESNQFVCTSDYVAIGMPSSPTGWKAP